MFQIVLLSLAKAWQLNRKQNINQNDFFTDIARIYFT